MPVNQTRWDEFITARRGHLLQSWAWGELKQEFGWTAVRIQIAGAGAQVLFRRLPLGLTIAHPRVIISRHHRGDKTRELLALRSTVARDVRLLRAGRL